jgi:hypothetical protein
MWPQSGLAAAGSPPAFAVYGVPGPSHDTVAPSPIDHTTRTGVALAVTTTRGTLADADLETAHHDGSTHNHIGNITNCGAGTGGFTTTSGRGNTNLDAATRPNAARPGATASGNHTSARREFGGSPGHRTR